MLGAGHADRNGQPDLVAHPLPDGLGDGRRRAEQVRRAGDVEERFVDRDALDQGSEVAQHVDDLIAQALVLAEVAADEPQRGAQRAGLSPGHATADAERLRLVGGGQHDAAADRDRPPAQARIEQLLDRGVERVEVGMQHRRLPDQHHRARLVEHLFESP